MPPVEVDFSKAKFAGAYPSSSDFTDANFTHQISEIFQTFLYYTFLLIVLFRNSVNSRF